MSSNEVDVVSAEPEELESVKELKTQLSNKLPPKSISQGKRMKDVYIDLRNPVIQIQDKER